jgi:hypothetical protein
MAGSSNVKDGLGAPMALFDLERRAVRDLRGPMIVTLIGLIITLKPTDLVLPTGSQFWHADPTNAGISLFWAVHAAIFALPLLAGSWLLGDDEESLPSGVEFLLGLAGVISAGFAFVIT